MVDASPPNDSPGRRLLGSAWAFWRSAQLLHEYDQSADAWATCFVNLGLAIELGLKGYCRQKGMNENQQRKIGHDLEQAYEKACRKGFDPKGNPIIHLISDLNRWQWNLDIRYCRGTSIEIVSLPAAIAMVRQFLADLWMQLAEDGL